MNSLVILPSQLAKKTPKTIINNKQARNKTRRHNIAFAFYAGGFVLCKGFAVKVIRLYCHATGKQIQYELTERITFILCACALYFTQQFTIAKKNPYAANSNSRQPINCQRAILPLFDLCCCNAIVKHFHACLQQFHQPVFNLIF